MKSLKKLEKFETKKLKKSPFAKITGGATRATYESSSSDSLQDQDK